MRLSRMAMLGFFCLIICGAECASHEVSGGLLWCRYDDQHVIISNRDIHVLGMLAKCAIKMPEKTLPSCFDSYLNTLQQKNHCIPFKN